MEAGFKFRIWWRHWSVVLFLAVSAGFVIWAMLNLSSWLSDLQDWRSARNSQKYGKPYQDDKYGGKTPEETLNFFITAIEKGDVELASRYFISSKQNQWNKTLQSYKGQGLLDEFLQELKILSSPDFVEYPNRIWKINEL